MIFQKQALIVSLLAAIFLPSSSFSQALQWAKQLGGAFGESRAVAIDNTGNVYTAGYYSGTIDFDPSPGTLYQTSTPGNHDIFITKLDDSGKLIWTRTFGGSSADLAFAITLDNNGNILLTGQFGATVDFDPGNGVFNLTAADDAADVYIVKLDNSGNFLWAKQFAGNSESFGYAVAADDAGNIYTAGYLQYSADFDPGPNQFILSATGIGGDIFISKLDESGNFIWAKRMGGTSSTTTSVDMAFGVAVDNAGNVYSTGIFENAADFDPGVETDSVHALGYDVFVSKLDANGDFVWARQVGGADDDFGRAIAIDAHGMIYVTGHFKGTGDFDPGETIRNLNSSGGADVFTIQLDSDGHLRWVSQQGGIHDDYAFAVALDERNNVYTTGQFDGFADFNPGEETFNLSPMGSADLFVSKLNQAGNFVWAERAGGLYNEFGYAIDVNSIGQLAVSGPFSGTADFDPGMDTATLTAAGNIDMFVLKLLQNCAAPGSIDSITACDSYTWMDGQVYTSSNKTAKVRLNSNAGCDSLVVLNLTIKRSSTSIDTISACDAYKWIDGNVYTASNNTAEFFLTNRSGCDSLITLQLTIKTIKPEIFVEADVIYSNVEDATYRWFNCDSNTYVINAIANTYTPSSSGNYGVEINQSGCVSRSDCTQILITSLEHSTDRFSLYPNPTNGSVALAVDEFFNGGQINVLNTLGQIIFYRVIDSKNTEFNINAPDGLYFVFLQGRTGKSTLVKLVKQHD